jgi:hypothetical protein
MPSEVNKAGVWLTKVGALPVFDRTTPRIKEIIIAQQTTLATMFALIPSRKDCINSANISNLSFQRKNRLFYNYFFRQNTGLLSYSTY